MKRVALALLLAVATSSAAAPAAPELRALQAKAQTGDANAQFAIAEAYRTGRGVTADPETAIMWYRRAASQGHVRASEELGFALFAHGDRREAMPYVEKAAARGDARALYLLGTAHFNGDYATRDWPLAYAQTMRAASSGLPAAQRNLELMDRYLLPADKAQADQILATLPAVRILPPAAPATPPQSVAAKSQPKAKSPLAAAASASGPTRSASGPWKVQLGAFGSADRARAQWTTVAAKAPRLATYDQRVVPWKSVQRLQAWGIASRSDAEALCKQVRAAGGQCLIVTP
ncbi:SPOR domain-containing protein [Sphingomonas crusticola]|uniref:SPOR domain-containing protein n=1 Tax=Sphingomonas crusticola TaxID=1697973 RepID=UPI000E23B3B5|nr:SPOR domain-containing protein [Sphingomonas crusticola]